MVENGTVTFLFVTNLKKISYKYEHIVLHVSTPLQVVVHFVSVKDVKLKVECCSN